MNEQRLAEHIVHALAALHISGANGVRAGALHTWTPSELATKLAAEMARNPLPNDSVPTPGTFAADALQRAQQEAWTAVTNEAGKEKSFKQLPLLGVPAANVLGSNADCQPDTAMAEARRRKEQRMQMAERPQPVSYQHFTDRARKVMQLANQEAQRFNHEYIGTEHVLLGLVKVGGGIAAAVLKNFGVDLRRIRLEVERLIQSGPNMVSMGRLPQTPNVKRVVEYTLDAARQMGCHHVCTEHLLLGLLAVPEGTACKVLLALGVTAEKVREEVLALLGQKNAPSGPEIDNVLEGWKWGPIVVQHQEVWDKYDVPVQSKEEFVCGKCGRNAELGIPFCPVCGGNKLRSKAEMIGEKLVEMVGITPTKLSEEEKKAIVKVTAKECWSLATAVGQKVDEIVMCPNCNGAGAIRIEDEDGWEDCQVCGGKHYITAEKFRVLQAAGLHVQMKEWDIPGFMVETVPTKLSEEEKKAIQKEVEKYSQGLQRWFALKTGITVSVDLGEAVVDRDDYPCRTDEPWHLYGKLNSKPADSQNRCCNCGGLRPFGEVGCGNCGDTHSPCFGLFTKEEQERLDKNAVVIGAARASQQEPDTVVLTAEQAAAAVHPVEREPEPAKEETWRDRPSLFP